MKSVPRLLAGVSMLSAALYATATSASAEGGYSERMREGLQNKVSESVGSSDRSFFQLFSHRKRPVIGNARPVQPAVEPPSSEALPDDAALIYRPEELQPLKETRFSVAAPSEPMAAAIYRQLQDPETSIEVTLGERKAIIASYAASGFKPLWTSAEGLGPRGAAVLKLLASSADDAMEPADYLPPVLGSYSDDLSAWHGDTDHLARLDLGLTAMALKFARHASSGRLIPDRLTGYNDIHPERVDPAQAMKVLAYSPFADSWLAGLQPRNPDYMKLKTAYLELRDDPDAASAAIIPDGKSVSPGQSDDRIKLVRARLSRLGYSAASSSPAELAGLPPDVRGRMAVHEPQLDPGLVAVLKDFQEKSGLKADGILGRGTIKALNSQNPRRNLLRLALNMDRMRWLPKDMGGRHVFMNQAAFELRVIDHDKEIWRTKVIIGKPQTQTFAFHDEIEMVVFNPSWGVPQSIITKEMLPLLRRDPAYLDHEGYRVITPQGRIVKSSSIDWSAYGDKVPLSVQQPPGDDNALGEIKFLFPNAHDIYMHDTPTKNLFKKSVRAYSHGCVRVENPRDFASLLMGLDRARIDEAIDSGRSETVRLKHKVPVHLVYFTAWPEADGKIAYYDDVYGRDARMEKAYSAETIAAR